MRDFLSVKVCYSASVSFLLAGSIIRWKCPVCQAVGNRVRRYRKGQKCQCWDVSFATECYGRSSSKARGDCIAQPTRRISREGTCDPAAAAAAAARVRPYKTCPRNDVVDTWRGEDKASHARPVKRTPPSAESQKRNDFRAARLSRRRKYWQLNGGRFDRYNPTANKGLPSGIWKTALRPSLALSLAERSQLQIT